jgi:hypothetical protein
VAAEEGQRRAEKESGHRRLLLPERKLRVLWDQRGGDPRFQVPGVWEEVHSAAEHSNVPIEKPLGNDEKNSIGVGIAGSMMNAMVKPAI